MSGADIAVAVLLAGGCAAVLLSVTGVVFARNFYERLHYIGPASTVGVTCVAAAVVVKESVNQAGMKAILIAIATILASAVSTHAIARAGRIEQRGDLRLSDAEKRRRLE